MQANAQVKLHNKFKITVLDAETSEIKREATAYNIVLDQMYKDLIDNTSIIKKIQLGTGTGMITPASTQMINRVLIREMKDRKLNYTNYDGTEFNITGKIIIEAGELVGETITEIGVASDYNLETHAFLKDSEGGIIGIEKTATEVLHIEATVYFTISFPNWITDYVQIFSLSTNSLITTMGYLIFFNPYENKFLVNANGIYKSAKIEKDYVNKKVIFNFLRYESGEANELIQKLRIKSDLTGAMTLKLKERTEGLQQIRDVNVGKGDGIIKNFILPSRDIKKDSLEVKINGVSVSNYELKTKIDYAQNDFSYLNTSRTTRVNVNNGYLLKNGNLALTLNFKGNSSLPGIRIVIYNNRLMMKKLIEFPNRDNIRDTLLYCSDNAENLVFRVYKGGINYEIEHVKNGEVEKEKTISVNANYFFRAPNSTEFWGYNSSADNKLYRYAYNDELKKYEANEVPFTIDPAAGASGKIYNTLAINDEGTKIYVLLNNKLLESEIPESGDMVFRKLIDVESGANFGASMDPISTYSPYFIYSKSGNTLKVRRLSHPEDVKKLDIPNLSNLKFIVLNPDMANIIVESYASNDTGQLYTIEFSDDGMSINFDSKIKERFSKKVGDICYGRDGYYGKYDCEKHIINFSTPPAPGAVITANYDGLSITKTENWVIDVSLEIAFSEGI